MVEALNRVGGRPGAADGQVDTRLLVRTDKWNGSEKGWPTWSFVTRAYAGSIDRDLSLDTTNAEISTDVSNVQLGGVQLNVVLKCNVQLRHESTENVLSCVFLVERCKTWCTEARCVGNFAGHERCGVHQNDKRRFECIGRRRDLSEIIQRCFREFWKKQGLRVRVLVLREATVSIT